MENVKNDTFNTFTTLLSLYNMKRTELQLASDRGYQLPNLNNSGFYTETKYAVTSRIYYQLRSFLINDAKKDNNRSLHSYLTVKYPNDSEVWNDFFDTISTSMNINKGSIINNILEYNNVSSSDEVDEDILEVLSRVLPTKNLSVICTVMEVSSAICRSNDRLTTSNIDILLKYLTDYGYTTTKVITRVPTREDLERFRGYLERKGSLSTMMGISQPKSSGKRGKISLRDYMSEVYTSNIPASAMLRIPQKDIPEPAQDVIKGVIEDLKDNAKLLVYYAPVNEGEKSVSKNVIVYDLTPLAQKVSPTQILFVRSKPLFSEAKKTLESLMQVTLRNTQTVDDAFLAFNCSHHVLVPKHKLLTATEAENHLARGRFSLSQLPSMCRDDPQVIYCGASPGSIIRIIQNPIIFDTFRRVIYRRVTTGLMPKQTKGKDKIRTKDE